MLPSPVLGISLFFQMMAIGVGGQIGKEFPATVTAPDTAQGDEIVRGININFNNSSMVLVPVKSTAKNNKIITPNNEECVCLNIYTCAKLGSMSSSSVKNYKVDRCIEYLNECCSLRSKSEKPKKTYSDQVTVVQPKPPKSNDEPERFKRNKRTSSSVNNYKCTDYSSGIERIYGQEYGEFPWMVSIYDFDPVSQSSIDYLCTGSLIHPQVVLTAAHCPKKCNLKTENLLIRAGELDSKPHQLSRKMFPHQDRRVSKIMQHEYYYQEYGQNDVALILLTKPFELQSNVGTICLPPQGYNANETRCKTTDWVVDDIDVINPNVKEPILRKVDLRIVPYKECVDRLRGTKLGDEFILHENFLCGGGEIGNGMCTFRPNGGTPLTCPVPGNPRRFFQLGIYSWRIGCGDSSPSVYLTVSKYRAWIDDKMADFDRSYYDADYEF